MLALWTLVKVKQVATVSKKTNDENNFDWQPIEFILMAMNIPKIHQESSEV